MSKTAVITARIDQETLALVDRVATAQGRSRSWFMSEAVRRVAESEADFLDFVQVGIDAADRGVLIPHDQVAAELQSMIARQKAR